MRNQLISVTSIYYNLKPIIPRKIQIICRRRAVLHKRLSYATIWPIYEKAKKPPAGWLGWPKGKKFALVLTHDVETEIGYRRCYDLMALEKELGFRSSFYFVPERYTVSAELRHLLINNGFEVGVHGLYHDGRLFKSKKIFQRRAILINHYLKEWKAAGFRSPAMQHNLDWIHDLNIEYDASTFDTDPFEPQPDGVGTIFPFWVQRDASKAGYVELPYTLPQDFTLFTLMGEKTIDIWKQKLEWVVANEGMALLNVHPDYMNFGNSRNCAGEYPAEYYRELLEHIKSEYRGCYWHALAKDVAVFCKENLNA
jgi:hypothetical protein